MRLADVRPALAARDPGGGARPGNGDAVEQRRHQARDQRRLEQLGDVLLGRDGIDHQDDRGRDQDAERAADRDRAGGKAAVVLVAQQLRQRRPAEGGGGRDRRAADRAERRAGARSPPSPARRAGARRQRSAARNSAVRQARLLGERAHQDEQRNDRERVVGELVVGVGLHVGEERATSSTAG